MLEAGYGVLFISILMVVACLIGWVIEKWEVRDVARRSVRTFRRCPQCHVPHVWDTERLVYYCGCTQRGARIVRLVLRSWMAEHVGGGRR